MPVKGVFITYRFQEKRANRPCRATWGNTRLGQKAEGVRGMHGSQPLLCFPQEGRLSSGTALGLDGLNDFSGLQIWGVVPTCPVPGPGVIWGRENIVLAL